MLWATIRTCIREQVSLGRTLTGQMAGHKYLHGKGRVGMLPSPCSQTSRFCQVDITAAITLASNRTSSLSSLLSPRASEEDSLRCLCYTTYPVCVCNGWWWSNTHQFFQWPLTTHLLHSCSVRWGVHIMAMAGLRAVCWVCDDSKSRGTCHA